MDCDTAKELLPFLDDDFIIDYEAVSVRRHLKQCESCRREYHGQAAMLRIVKTALTQNERPCSPEFLSTLQTKINRKRESRVLYRLAFSAAAIVVLAIGVLMYSFFPTTAKNPAFNNGFVFNGSTAELEQYVAAQYLNVYELSSIIDEPSTVDDINLLETFLSTHYFDVSAEDIVETLSTDDLEQFFASN